MIKKTKNGMENKKKAIIDTISRMLHPIHIDDATRLCAFNAYDWKPMNTPLRSIFVVIQIGCWYTKADVFRSFGVKNSQNIKGGFIFG